MARLRVTVHLNDALVAALRRGELDLAISALPSVVPEDLEVTSLMPDDLCIVVRSGHPLLSRRRLRLQDLKSVEWLLPGPEVFARRGLEARLAEAGLPSPRVAIEVSSSA